VSKASGCSAVHRTAGRIENAQVAAYLTYAAPRGHAFIDRALYLPESWTGDPDRRVAAGIPAEVEFATKPQLAADMITRAVTAGVPAEWVAGDEVYGADPRLRRTSAATARGYVLQIAANRRVPTAAGPIRVDRLAATIPERAWQERSAGTGSKGPPALLLGLGRAAAPRTPTTPDIITC
jgi:SRSO17 transposase